MDDYPNSKSCRQIRSCEHDIMLSEPNCQEKPLKIFIELEFYVENFPDKYYVMMDLECVYDKSKSNHSAPIAAVVVVVVLVAASVIIAILIKQHRKKRQQQTEYMMQSKISRGLIKRLWSTKLDHNISKISVMTSGAIVTFHNDAQSPQNRVRIVGSDGELKIGEILPNKHVEEMPVVVAITVKPNTNELALLGHSTSWMTRPKLKILVYEPQEDLADTEDMVTSCNDIETWRWFFLSMTWIKLKLSKPFSAHMTWINVTELLLALPDMFMFWWLVKFNTKGKVLWSRRAKFENLHHVCLLDEDIWVTDSMQIHAYNKDGEKKNSIGLLQYPDFSNLASLCPELDGKFLVLYSDKDEESIGIVSRCQVTNGKIHIVETFVFKSEEPPGVLKSSQILSNGHGYYISSRKQLQAYTPVTMEKIRTGDMIRILDDEAAVKNLQKGHGGWHDHIRKNLGKIGCVVDGSPGEDVVTLFGEDSCQLNPYACVKLSTDEKKDMFTFGDKIYVEYSNESAKWMQKNHGGWSDGMEMDLERIGKVIGVDGDGDVHVLFWTGCFRLNPAACKLITTEYGCSFSKGDKVFLDSDLDIAVVKDLQESHRAWRTQIAQHLGYLAEVVDIDEDNDLIVKSKVGKAVLHPETCTKITSQTRAWAEVKAGQKVTIDLPITVFRQLQENHGGFNDSMIRLIGQVGKILHILEDGDLLVEFSPNMWCLNPAICSKLSDMPQPKVAKGDKVYIGLPVDVVKQLQEGHGEFMDKMCMLQGKVGKVTEVTPFEDVIVHYGKEQIMYHPALLSTVTTVDMNGPAMASSIPGEVCELQEGHGGWNKEKHKDWTWKQVPKGSITSLSMSHLTGHVVCCLLNIKNISHSVYYVTSGGQFQTSNPLTHPTDLEPHRVSVHHQTSDLVTACKGTENNCQHFVACFRFTETNLWSGSPTHMEIEGEWTDSDPSIAWLNAREAVVSLCDQSGVWWLIAIDMDSKREVRRLRTDCEVINDLSVAPEGDIIYVCDIVSDSIHIFTPTEFSHRFHMSSPSSVCAVNGKRALVCHLVSGEQSFAVTLRNHEGVYMKDLVLGMSDLLGPTYRVCVREEQCELYLSDMFSLRKYNLDTLPESHLEEDVKQPDESISPDQISLD